jgi:hypothetical protein
MQGMLGKNVIHPPSGSSSSKTLSIPEAGGRKPLRNVSNYSSTQIIVYYSGVDEYLGPSCSPHRIDCSTLKMETLRQLFDSRHSVSSTDIAVRTPYPACETVTYVSKNVKTPSSGSRRRVFIPEKRGSMFLRNVTQVVIINYENYKIICDFIHIL